MPTIAYTDDLKSELLKYKEANHVEREAIILDKIAALDQLPEKVNLKDPVEAIEIYREMAYTATIIHYAEVLNNVENQRFFDILVYFKTMTFKGEFEQLNELFEINAQTSQMRLKCAVDDPRLNKDTWELFRKAQKEHLQALDNEAEARAPKGQTLAPEKRKLSMFNFSDMDPANPPEDQLIPLQIQMLSRFSNEVVDSSVVSAKGKYRFIKKPGVDMFQLPCGDKVELQILSEAAKQNPELRKRLVDDLIIRKMVEVHLEEEYANLFEVAASHYDNLPNDTVDVFAQALAEVFEQEKSLPADMIGNFIQAAGVDDVNSVMLANVIAAIDKEIKNTKRIQKLLEVDIKEFEDALELFGGNLQTTDEKNEPDAHKKLVDLQNGAKDNLAINKIHANRNMDQLKSLLSLRSTVQVKTFAKTALFGEAFKFAKENTDEVMIQELCDFRGVGCSNMSHSFLLKGTKGKCLEDVFKGKGIFKGPVKRFEENSLVIGAEIHHLTLHEVLAKFKSVRFSHILNVLANQEAALKNQSVTVKNTWVDKQYEEARKVLKTEARKLFVSQAKALKPEDLWNIADTSLGKAMADISKKKRGKINTAVNVLKGRLSKKPITAEEMQAAYAAFKNNCTKILNKREQLVLNSILTILAVVVAMILAAVIGFGIGFIAGAWAGPGAFFTAVAGGAIGACAVVAVTGAAGILTGGLVGHGLFKNKLNIKAEKDAVKRYIDVAHEMDPVVADIPGLK